MLSYKINKNITTSFSNDISIKESRINGSLIEIICNIPHRMSDGDIITLNNTKKNSVFALRKKISFIDDITFSVEYNDKYRLYINETKEIETIYGINGKTQKSLLINLKDSDNFIKDFGSNSVVKKIYNNNQIDLNGVNKGDKILFNDIFLYESLDNNGTLSSDFLNIRTTLLVVIDNIYYTIENCIIPVNFDCNNDEYNIIWFYENTDNDNIVKNYLLQNGDNSIIYKYDDRFFDLEKKTLLSDVRVYKENNFLNIKIPSSNDFATNLFQEELVDNNFIKKEKEKAINPIVNMEKYSFSPVCISLYNIETIPIEFMPITEIEFNFHFRYRSNSDNWTSSDNDYWNSYVYDDERKRLIYRYSDNNGKSNRFYSIDQSDLIGYLNFNNEDVLYQKSKIKKSFIRLLFYDSRDIKVQKLLFYSTIFLNSGVLFGKYTNNINTEGYVSKDGTSGLTGIDVNYEYNPTNSTDIVDETKRLSTRINIHDKYDNSSCSEGFYLYLYADNISLYIPKKIYMKVEYNHAGYGRTIPFIMPVGSLNIPLDPVVDYSFPVTYEDKVWNEVNENYNGPSEIISEYDFTQKNGEEGKVYEYNNHFYTIGNSINMTNLYNDMFIELNVKYDEKNKQYVWFLPRYMGYGNGRNQYGRYDGKMIFNLFEPKIQ